MNFTILSPGDSPVKDSKSDTSATNFGGHREHSTVADAKDYTKRTGAAPEKKENPEDVTKDVDDMTDPQVRKREFSYQEDKSDAQKGNESGFIVKTDKENIPRMDEGSEVVQVPETSNVKQHRKPNQWHFGTESVYEGEIS